MATLDASPKTGLRLLPVFGWAFLTFLAVAVAAVSFRYVLPTVPFPSSLPNFVIRRPWLVAHAIFSSVALLVGPWQFLRRLRLRAPGVHRWTGRVYCGAVLAGWLTSLPIAAHAATGTVASAGFLLLGLLWISSTTAGYRTAVSGQMRGHRKWMIRSYALTAAAITLRIYLPVAFALRIPFPLSYPSIAWACWVPNLLVVEWFLRRRPGFA